MATVVSLVPETVDLTVYAGDGLSILVTVTDSDGAPIALTGTVLAQVRQWREDTSPLVAFTVDASDAAAGIVQLSLTGAQTAALNNGENRFQGVWDVQWTSLADVPKTLVQGKLISQLDVTRA